MPVLTDTVNSVPFWLAATPKRDGITQQHSAGEQVRDHRWKPRQLVECRVEQVLTTVVTAWLMVGAVAPQHAGHPAAPIRLPWTARRRPWAPTRQPVPPLLKPAAAVRYRPPAVAAGRTAVTSSGAAGVARTAGGVDRDGPSSAPGTAGRPGCGSIRSLRWLAAARGFRLPPEPGARRRGADDLPAGAGRSSRPGRKRVSRPTAKGIPSTPRRDRQPYTGAMAPRPPARRTKTAAPKSRTRPGLETAASLRNQSLRHHDLPIHGGARPHPTLAGIRASRAV